MTEPEAPPDDVANDWTEAELAEMGDRPADEADDAPPEATPRQTPPAPAAPDKPAQPAASWTLVGPPDGRVEIVAANNVEVTVRLVLRRAGGCGGWPAIEGIARAERASVAERFGALVVEDLRATEQFTAVAAAEARLTALQAAQAEREKAAAEAVQRLDEAERSGADLDRLDALATERAEAEARAATARKAADTAARLRAEAARALDGRELSLRAIRQKEANTEWDAVLARKAEAEAALVHAVAPVLDKLLHAQARPAGRIQLQNATDRVAPLTFTTPDGGVYHSTRPYMDAEAFARPSFAVPPPGLCPRAAVNHVVPDLDAVEAEIRRRA